MMLVVPSPLQLRRACGLETRRQAAPHQLARRVAREGLEIKEAAAQLLGAGHFGVDKRQNFLQNTGAVGDEHGWLKVDVAHGYLGLLDSVPGAADAGLCHKWMGVQDVLELGRRDLVALVLDEVLFSVGEPDVALSVDAADVAGAEPAVVEGEDLFVGLGVLLVATVDVSGE